MYTTTVPTAAIASGVFPSTVTNPATGQPFANNTIPSALFDPVALDIQKLLPAPNQPGLVNNYVVVQSSPSTSKWYVDKVDYIHSGIPFTPTVATQDLSGSGANQCYCGFAWLPNQTGCSAVANQSINNWFNTAAYTTLANGTFGNVRRNSLTGPNWRDLDLSLGKGFDLFRGIHPRNSRRLLRCDQLPELRPA